MPGEQQNLEQQLPAITALIYQMRDQLKDLITDDSKKQTEATMTVILEVQKTHGRLDILNGKVASHEKWITEQQLAAAKKCGAEEIEKQQVERRAKILGIVSHETFRQVLWFAAAVLLATIIDK